MESDVLQPEHWEALERVIPFTGGTHTVDDIREGIDSGRLQPWPGERSIIITEIVTTPGHTILRFFLAAGNMREMRRLYPIILDWGRSQGCTKTQLIGRRGWERSFLTREEGWEPVAVVFERDLWEKAAPKPKP